MTALIATACTTRWSFDVTTLPLSAWLVAVSISCSRLVSWPARLGHLLLPSPAEIILSARAKQ
ncbi:MAG TPA: hypothetical protein VNA68_01420 [Candidatus Dormibacteraeota bacterium]|nr:hypothetical protein [Candidatus Dormibacteraeota bacterium]